MKKVSVGVVLLSHLHCIVVIKNDFHIPHLRSKSSMLTFSASGQILSYIIQSQIIIQVTDFLRNVRVLLGIQLNKNDRFDCKFVLKYYSS